MQKSAFQPAEKKQPLMPAWRAARSLRVPLTSGMLQSGNHAGGRLCITVTNSNYANEFKQTGRTFLVNVEHTRNCAVCFAVFCIVNVRKLEVGTSNLIRSGHVSRQTDYAWPDYNASRSHYKSLAFCHNYGGRTTHPSGSNMHLSGRACIPWSGHTSQWSTQASQCSDHAVHNI